MWENESLVKPVRIPVTIADLVPVVEPIAVVTTLLGNGFVESQTCGMPGWAKTFADPDGDLFLVICLSPRGASDVVATVSVADAWCATVEDFRPPTGQRDEASRVRLIRAACAGVFAVHSYTSGYSVANLGGAGRDARGR